MRRRGAVLIGVMVAVVVSAACVLAWSPFPFAGWALSHAPASSDAEGGGATPPDDLQEKGQADTTPPAPGAGALGSGVTTCPPHIPCTLCGSALPDRAFRYPAGAGYACPPCHAAFPPCVYCGLPSTAKEDASVGTDTDAAPMCRACRDTRVDTEAELLALWDRVRLDAERGLRMRIPEGVEVSFFVGERARLDIGHVGGAGAELGRFSADGAGGRIHIQRHLPRALAYDTLAHELGHAWVAAHVEGGMPLLEEEGFCQWVSAKLLHARGMHRRRALLDARTDALGEAYRGWLALERSGTDPVGMLRHR